jgi:hypothetical protein
MKLMMRYGTWMIPPWIAPTMASAIPDLTASKAPAIVRTIPRPRASPSRFFRAALRPSVSDLPSPCMPAENDGPADAQTATQSTPLNSPVTHVWNRLAVVVVPAQNVVAASEVAFHTAPQSTLPTSLPIQVTNRVPTSTNQAAIPLTASVARFQTDPQSI